MKRNSVAEFSHRVSLLNERENVELRKIMSNLTLARKQSLQSFETEILKVKLKAKKLNLNVMDYTERKQGMYHLYKHADERENGQEQKARAPSRTAFRRHSISGEQQRHVSFQEAEVKEADKPPIQKALSDNGMRPRTSYTRPSSASLSVDFLFQGKPVSYPKTKEMMVNSYINNNSAKSKPSMSSSTRRESSLNFDDYRPSSVSYNDMQSTYKVLHCIGKRSVSALDGRDSASSVRRRKFLVTPKRRSSSSLSRPKTSGSNS